jgi:uncharacterized Zn finger protein
VSDDERRIGRGSWARLFASTVVGDEGSREAEHGRRLVGDVDELRVASGELEARVEGCVVTLGAEPVPPRVWTAITRFARGSQRLEAGVRGREQSVHLMHLMEIDWDEPLLPRANRITRACTCDGGGGCAHVAAVAYVVASKIDDDPGVLLRWRGLDAAEPEEERPVPTLVPDESWRAGTLPPPVPLRPLPVGAVLGRLGASGVDAAGEDVSTVLRRAYEAFSAPPVWTLGSRGED